jgi:REP element-mobilizing transposase RayT
MNEKVIYPSKPPRLTIIYDQLFPVFFITFVTHNRRQILAVDPVHNCFLKYCRRGTEFGVFVSHYVIMPDHVHLALRLGWESVGMTVFICGLRGAMTKTLHGLDITGPIWQAVFFDRLLRSDESYIEKAEYIWGNPHRAGLVSLETEWPYLGNLCNAPKL